MRSQAIFHTINLSSAYQLIRQDDSLTPLLEAENHQASQAYILQRLVEPESKALHYSQAAFETVFNPIDKFVSEAGGVLCDEPTNATRLEFARSGICARLQDCCDLCEVVPNKLLFCAVIFAAVIVGGPVAVLAGAGGCIVGGVQDAIENNCGEDAPARQVMR